MGIRLLGGTPCCCFALAVSDDNSYYINMAQATVGESQAPATTRDRILAAAAEVFAERVGEFVDANREDSRALVLEAHVAARRDETVGALLRDFQSERLAALRDLVADAQTRGEVADGLDPTTVATLFLAIPLGIVLL